MTLSGWTRLWIVGAVIWWIAGAVILVPQLPAKNAFAQGMEEACRGPNPPTTFGDCATFIPMLEEWYRDAWWAMAPQLALWIAGPLVAWGVWRWIRKGFVPGSARRF